jgi:ubiquinone/menaquinone biosynthesis C-methylase UbiE
MRKDEDRQASRAVESHYGHGKILDLVLNALRAAGKDLDRLTPADLAPVDQFHIRGREATVELAGRAALRPGMRVLDVGCGLGGSARYLAAEWKCYVTGIDLTGEYIEAAKALAELTGLAGTTSFLQGSALDLPFAVGSFDIVWTEHVQMNIADKRAFYSEISRVLVPGGRLLFHDIFQGNGGTLYYPVPWAEDSSISFLATPAEVLTLLENLGFRILDWQDKSRQSLAWFAAAALKLNATAPAPLGLHLLMGANTADKFSNNIRNLTEQRFVVIQAVAGKEDGQ